MPTKYLDLADLDDLIRSFEREWKVSSLEMLMEPPVRSNIPEHVLLRWEAYIRQRIQLRENYEELRAGYLSHIPRSGSKNELTPREQSELAA